MNKINNYRRSLIKGVLALVGGFFFLKLARIGLGAAQESAEVNQGSKRVSEPGMARNGFEGVSVEAWGAMFGTGKKLG
jgi:hypothetical protein